MSHPDDPSKRDGESPTFPGVVRAAGVIWMVVGVLFIVFTCGGTFASILIEAKQAARAKPNPGQAPGTCLGVALGVAYLIAGRRLSAGTLKDTIVPAVLSVIVAGLYLLLGVGGIVLGIGANAPRAMLFVGLFSLVVGFASLLPAVLAMVGRSRYLEWRAAQEPPPRRRRRHRDDYDDPDDDDYREPRRPRMEP